MIKVDWVIARAEGVADAPASQVTVTAVSCRGGVASEQAKLAD
jgi:hypothetical protein